MAQNTNHRLKRMQRQEVDFGYLRGCSAPDIEAVNDEVHAWTKKLIEPVPFPETSKTIAANVSRYATMMLLRDMASLGEIDERASAKLPIAAILAKTAFNAFVVCQANYADYRIPPIEIPQTRELSQKLADGKAALAMGTMGNGTSPARPSPGQFAERFVQDLAATMGLEAAESPQAAARAIMDAMEDAIQEADTAEKLSKKMERKLSKNEKELDAARTRINELERSLEAETSAKKATEKQHDALIRSLEDEHAEIARMRGDAEAMLKEAASVPSSQTAAADDLRDALAQGQLAQPKSATDIPELASLVFGQSILFSDKALDDISSFKGRCEEAWLAICALATNYLPGAIEGRPPESRTFKELAGFELSANEAGQTKSNPKMQAERTAQIAGKTIYSQMHLKGQSSFGDNILRIYFDYLPEEQSIGIIRCTGHLATMGSKRHGM